MDNIIHRIRSKLDTMTQTAGSKSGGLSLPEIAKLKQEIQVLDQQTDFSQQVEALKRLRDKTREAVEVIASTAEKICTNCETNLSCIQEYSSDINTYRATALKIKNMVKHKLKIDPLNREPPVQPKKPVPREPSTGDESPKREADQKVKRYSVLITALIIVVIFAVIIFVVMNFLNFSRPYKYATEQQLR